MQHGTDEMIWQVINHQFCSFKTTIGKAKSDKTHFCKHPYSVTGLCNRTSCPLANSKYATIREDNGRVSLFMKTVERAHSPKNLWEKIVLSRNYSKAIAQLDEHLAYFPKVLIHRNKQRLTKIHQYLIRMRKIKLREISGRKAKMVGIHRKIEQREERRERKALVAAKIERSIQKELVERLAKGTYGDIYNFPEAPYQKALQQVEDDDDKEKEEEEEETDEETEEDEEEEGVVEYVEDLESDEEELEQDMEDMEYMGSGAWGKGSDDDEDDNDNDGQNDDDSESSSDSEQEEDDSEDSSGDRPKKKKRPDPKKKPAKAPPRRRGTRIEIEYEEEREDGAVAEGAKVAW